MQGIKKYILLYIASSFACSSYAATLNITVTDQDNKPVKDAVITLRPDSKHPVKPDNKAIIDQINKTYVPHVKVVTIGSKIFFPNKDDIRHHVYSFSETKQFELPLYEGTPAAPVIFDKPGIVTLGCNIHDWMRAYIYIADTPFFDKSNAKGIATVKDIPAGIYQVNAWHPRIESKSKILVNTITLKKNSHINDSHQLDLKPNIKIRRAPKARRTRY